MKLHRILPLALLAAAACGGIREHRRVPRQRAHLREAGHLAERQRHGRRTRHGGSAHRAATTPDCHPHLFVRTGEIVERVNRHFRKHLHHVEELIRNNPIADGETKTWEDVRDGTDRKFTMTRAANLDGSSSFTFELDLAAVPASGSPPSSR